MVALHFIARPYLAPRPAFPQKKLLPRCMQTMRGNAARKADRLREMIGRYGQCGELATLRVALPLDPSVLLDGILPQECGVFKSAMTPLRLTFKVAGAPGWVHFCKVSRLPKSCAVHAFKKAAFVPLSGQHRCCSVRLPT